MNAEIPRSPVTAVVGAQWGDEGKGRIVDYLAQDVDMVIRFQGGDNAGHTVVLGENTFKLHLVPSGIFNPETKCILGTGMVINPGSLLQEISGLEEQGVDTSNLWISQDAHMILPFHPALDGLSENSLGKSKIGTTKKGIGPAYTDKAARIGVRAGDLLRPEILEQQLRKSVEAANIKLRNFGQEEVIFDAVYTQMLEYGNILGPRIINAVAEIRDAVSGNKKILLEGQLGIMRSLDSGAYPYVTSSDTTVGAAYEGAPIPAGTIGRRIGVVKAYTTSVGEGPFPTELFDEHGSELRRVGAEYGATTGRPRRCGWYDAVAMDYSAHLNGFTELAVTKLDVLDDFDEVKVCIGYEMPDGTVFSPELDGARREYPHSADLGNAKPIYETYKGWKTKTSDVQAWDQLPYEAQVFLNRISELAHVPIGYVSVGPERHQMFDVRR